MSEGLMILMYSVGSHLLNKLELENNQSSCNREKLGLKPPCCKKNKNKTKQKLCKQ